MNTYYTIRMYTDFWIPLVIFGLILVVGVIWLIWNSIKEMIVNRFFTKHGYERKLLDVASFGGKCFYGWVRERNGKVTVADDRVIKHMSYKEIKEHYGKESED